jgi:L-alanine-DL-glutamate epimerase-like enolase superfamily enzyme
MVAVGERLFPDAPTPDQGWIEISDRPGLGFTLDRDAWYETLIDM